MQPHEPAEPDESDGPSGSDDVTRLLRNVNRGDGASLDRLFERIQSELRGLAAQQLKGERPDHTLQPTALVNEAFLRLVDASSIDWQDSRHFYAIAARIMRRVLVDHARARGAQKRGSGREHVTLIEDVAQVSGSDVDLLVLEEALTKLSERSERQGKIVEMRYFAGLGVPQVASALGVSEATVKTDWRIAKAFLRAELSGDEMP